KASHLPSSNRSLGLRASCQLAFDFADLPGIGFAGADTLPVFALRFGFRVTTIGKPPCVQTRLYFSMGTLSPRRFVVSLVAIHSSSGNRMAWLTVGARSSPKLFAA